MYWFVTRPPKHIPRHVNVCFVMVLGVVAVDVGAKVRGRACCIIGVRWRQLAVRVGGCSCEQCIGLMLVRVLMNGFSKNLSRGLRRGSCGWAYSHGSKDLGKQSFQHILRHGVAGHGAQLSIGDSKGSDNGVWADALRSHEFLPHHATTEGRDPEALRARFS